MHVEYLKIDMVYSRKERIALMHGEIISRL